MPHAGFLAVAWAIFTVIITKRRLTNVLDLYFKFDLTLVNFQTHVVRKTRLHVKNV